VSILHVLPICVWLRCISSVLSRQTVVTLYNIPRSTLQVCAYIRGFSSISLPHRNILKIFLVIPRQHKLKLLKNSLRHQNMVSTRTCNCLPQNLILCRSNNRRNYSSVNIKVRRTIILPVALYGCENWTLALREE
jgi:hypothetical protein